MAKLIIKEKSFAFVHPELLNEWDFDKNNILPQDVSYGSTMKVWWKCDVCNGKYFTPVSYKSKGYGCPYCTGHRILVGFNDVESHLTESNSSWDYDKNNKLPSEVLYSSATKRWWICKNGHSHEQSPLNKIVRKQECPYCCSPPKRILKGFNDLQTKFPHIASEWNYKKNHVGPDEVFPCSNQKAWWICPDCKYEYQTVINDRTSQISNCPKCSTRGSSISEIFMFVEIKKYFNDAVYRDDSNGFELDTFIPSMNIGIEFDGKPWHKNIERDINKNKKCIEKGINLIRLKDKIIPKTDNCTEILFESSKIEDISKAIKKLISYLGIENPEVDFNKDIPEIYKIRKAKYLENSLVVTHPDIAKDWDYERNFPLLPENFTYGSNAEVFWKNEKGIWKDSICHRTIRGRSFPKKIGKNSKVVEKYK